MLRKAKIADTKKIHTLLTFFAKKGRLLPRSLNYIYEHIRDFWVYTHKTEIVGCCSLHIVGWDHLAEIKSLAVKTNFQKKGIGNELVKTCIEEARDLGIKKIFALTFVPHFFEHLGFTSIDKAKLSHKIWADCIHCSQFPNCKEIALIYNLNSRKKA